MRTDEGNTALLRPLTCHRSAGEEPLAGESVLMKQSFQVFLGLFGITAIVIASLHIILGPSAIPGSIPVNATMDSEDRFYATLFAAYGVALLWCIKDIERKSTVVYFLALSFF